MEVVLDTVHEKLHDVLGGGGSFGALPFHDGDQLSDDFTMLVSVGRKNHQDELIQHVVYKKKLREILTAELKDMES